MMLKDIILSAALVALHSLSANANPVAVQSLERRVDCDDLSKYTVQYFLDNKIAEPEDASCVFYTRYLSDTAIRYVKSSPGLVTIWDLWSCEHYIGDDVDTNPLRCIFSDNSTRTTYFEHMSEAMALSCNIAAWVLTDDPHNIPQDGIWARTEQPALMREGNPGGRVDIITAANTGGGDLVIVWQRPGVTAEGGKIKGTEELFEGWEGRRVQALRKRQDDRCFPPEQIEEWFHDVPF